MELLKIQSLGLRASVSFLLYPGYSFKRLSLEIHFSLLWILRSIECYKNTPAPTKTDQSKHIHVLQRYRGYVHAFDTRRLVVSGNLLFIKSAYSMFPT